MCETNARLEGKVAIVTGGSSGIGLEAAKDLAYRGAKVIIASRNETKLKIAREQIEEATGNADITYRILDLGSLKSVRNFSSGILEKTGRIDILVNNAGALALPDILTADDLNLTMQVNYFGTFLLTYLLLPLLKSSSPSRIINGSAVSMYIGHIDFDKWNDIGRYSVIASLANSKLAMALYTVELSRRLNGFTVTANSYDPFVVRDSFTRDIFSNFNGILRDVSEFFVNTVGQRKEEVGKQIGYLAAAPELKEVSGNHYKFCASWLNHWDANNLDLTKKLWEESKRLVKITPEEDWETKPK